MKCEHCNNYTTSVVIHNTELWCWSCHNETKGKVNQAPGVIQDSIEGGLQIKHGLCNPDGSPRTFYSKSEIKRAAYETGWTIHGDTPKVNPRIKESRLQAQESKS